MRISDWSSDVCSSDLIIPAQYRVIVTVRPRMVCRSCGDSVAQAKAPAHVVPGGLPREALLADILVKKYADHLPLYRQAQMLARQGVTIDRATLAGWVGRAAGYLEPIGRPPTGEARQT